MARSPIARHNCPLYERETTWSECVEVHEVREDEMDAARLREPFDMDRANEVCEECKWYVVEDDG